MTGHQNSSRYDSSSIRAENLARTESDGGRNGSEIGGKISRDQYETILKNIRDAVYTLDPDGRITWVNEVAIEEFDGGFDRTELIGSSVAKILPERDIAICVEYIAELLSGDRSSARCEVTLLTADGTEIPVELHLALLPFEDGTFQGTVGVARDITEQKRREQRLTVLNRILRHDLRNDMNVILGHVERLLADETIGHHRKNLEIIKDEANALVRLGENARYFDKIVRRDCTSLQAIDCVDVLAECCATFESTYPEISIHLSSPDTALVQADDSLTIAFENIIENAIIHNDRDAPTIRIGIESTSDDGTVDVVVSDDGPGIPPQEVAVFDRLDESPLEHSSGLGMWLVHWIVTEIDGSVTFTESSFGGTEVRITLPTTST